MSKVTEQAVLAALRHVEDPDLRQDIVSLGFVKDLKIDGGRVAFAIELTTPACPVKDMMKNAAANAVGEIPGVESVDITMTAQVRGHQGAGGPAAAGGGPVDGHVPGVKHIVPVASGKGGVGKSTVAVNLAVALAAQGARVGLMDADIYGPSVPTLMGITQAPQVQDGHIVPVVEQHGVKVISMGFFIDEEQAVVWRGPMLAKALDEFLGNVAWGELDYLIVDLPPGTGDVQLSLCQKLALTGAVVVSTPQDVALKVAQKAITLFEMLQDARARPRREHELLRLPALRRARRHLRQRRHQARGRGHGPALPRRAAPGQRHPRARRPRAAQRDGRREPARQGLPRRGRAARGADQHPHADRRAGGRDQAELLGTRPRRRIGIGQACRSRQSCCMIDGEIRRIHLPPAATRRFPMPRFAAAARPVRLLLALCALLALAPAARALPDFSYEWGHPWPQGDTVYGFAFADAQHGWAVCGGGTVLATTDGGESWSLHRHAARRSRTSTT